MSFVSASELEPYRQTWLLTPEQCRHDTRLFDLHPNLQARIRFGPLFVPLDCRCWVWVGRINRNGYGRCWSHELKSEPVAHRETYRVLRGPVPAKLQLDHLCFSRFCVNPWHLEPVTPRENTLRGAAVLYKPLHQSTPIDPQVAEMIDVLVPRGGT